MGFKRKLLAGSLAMIVAGGTFAQESETVVGEADEANQPVRADVEEIIVTGSRIRRDEFSSASPLQIIDGIKSREVGLVDTTALLQSASQATGYQIDNTFTSFVLDNGPGSAQVNLRGLGAERVLLLLNSRRLAPGGVGGAPTSPDISTIPNIMIDRVEYLLDGASSIYGSDAVSGVANVIMRKDFEGFEIEGQIIQPDSRGGEETQFGAAFGTTGDNWSFGVAGEVYDRERVRYRDREYTAECDRYIHETETGEILNIHNGLVPGTTDSPCKLNTINRVFIGALPFGNVWFTDGESNIGVPNFSETEIGVGFGSFNPTINDIDIDGDGVADTGLIDPDGNGRTEVDLQTDAYNFNGSERYLDGDLLSGTRRYNLFAYGEYDLANEGNTTLYGEFLWSRRETQVFSPGAPIFPDVPADNPYNICNQNSPFGANCTGFFGGLNFGNLGTIPIVMIRGDRDFNDVEIDQYRFVGGVTGDLPSWQNDSGFGNWAYDAYITYSTSEGTDAQRGILEAELTTSLANSQFDADGNIVCEGCVPVNMFAPSIYTPGGGTFATQAETDYLFGDRTFVTEVDQTVISGVLQGDLFELPWNNTTVPLVAGIEWRRDEINSIPNNVAADGLLIAFFKDGGAVGSRDITELFLETEFMLLENVPGAEELSFNLATRWTDESTYGDDITYSAKTLYTPVDGLTFRGTYGTSFRAPNAQEQFLKGQSGFVAIVDPCVVPGDAQVPALDPSEPAGYDPTQDDREQRTLDNCVAQGVDPLTLGLEEGSLNQYSVEVLRKGGQEVQLTIDPETSTSWTGGIVVDQPFFDAFTMRFGATYYDIEVEDSISLLGTGFVVNDCYVENDVNESGFCRFITRDADGFIEQVDSSFVNINSLTSRGIDYNLFYQQNFIVADRSLDLELDVRMTRVLENNFIFENSSEDDAGTPVAPEWEGSFVFTASYADLRWNWRGNYIAGEQDENAAFATNPPCERMAVLCRPVARTSYYMTHTTSITWEPGDWSVTFGISNMFDETPPLMDTAAPEIQVANLPLGVGYDILGRRVFAQFRMSL